MSDDNDQSAVIWQAGYDAAVADINARNTANIGNYFLMDTDNWQVVLDGSLEEADEFVRVAVEKGRGVGKNRIYIRTYGQIPSIHDIAQLRQDATTKKLRREQYELNKAKTLATVDPDTIIAIEPKDMN